MEEFVPLVCPQCGGKIELTKAQYEENFILSGADHTTVIYVGVTAAQDGAKCQHCGTEFAKKSRFQPAKGALDVINSIEGRATAIGKGAVAKNYSVQIGGSFSGNMVIGDNNKVRGSGKDSNIVTGDGNDVDA